MSRIGRKVIAVPTGTKVSVKDNVVLVQGPKGQLSREFRPQVSLEITESQVVVTRCDDSKEARSLHGLTRSLVANMVEGVTNGFTKNLELVGVGYKAQMKGKNLLLNVGYSHPIEIEPPEGIEIATEGVTKVAIKGIDKENVGNLSAKIRAVRKPEPYKGKGIRYVGEKIRKKAGKAK